MGTGIGTTSTIMLLTIAAAPFAARLIEGSFLEVDKGAVKRRAWGKPLADYFYGYAARSHARPGAEHCCACHYPFGLFCHGRYQGWRWPGRPCLPPWVQQVPDRCHHLVHFAAHFAGAGYSICREFFIQAPALALTVFYSHTRGAPYEKNALTVAWRHCPEPVVCSCAFLCLFNSFMGSMPGALAVRLLSLVEFLLRFWASFASLAMALVLWVPRVALVVGLVGCAPYFPVGLIFAWGLRFTQYEAQFAAFEKTLTSAHPQPCSLALCPGRHVFAQCCHVGAGGGG